MAPFTDVYDGASNVYPYRTPETKLDPRDIDQGDIVMIEGRIVCRSRSLPGWDSDLELVTLYLMEKRQNRFLKSRLGVCAP